MRECVSYKREGGAARPSIRPRMGEGERGLDLDARVRALFVVVLVADFSDARGRLVEVGELVAIEQRRGLLECAVLRLHDEDVEEHELERDKRAVDDLRCVRRTLALDDQRGTREGDARSTSMRCS